MDVDTLITRLDALAHDPPDDPHDEARNLAAHARILASQLDDRDRARLAIAVLGLAEVLQTRLDHDRATERARIGTGRRALRGYAHLRPHHRAQRFVGQV